MNSTSPHRIVPAALLLASAAPLSAQNIDWGSWTSPGSALYENGDSITITSLVNGSVSDLTNEAASPHSISSPAFPYSTAPGAGEYGYFHNESATTSDWSVKIDLSNFSLNSNSVIGFSNLDGRDFITLTRSYASIVFLDADNNPVSVSSATFAGAFDNNWSGFNWDSTSTFDLSTGIWDVVPDSGSSHPAGGYFAAVGNAFFLTNLPANISSIVYTKTGPTSYTYDSTLFYAGTAVPEPAGGMLVALAGVTGLLHRRRKSAGL